MDLEDLLYLAGVGLIAGGVAVLTVWPWALVVVGIGLVVSAVLGDTL